MSLQVKSYFASNIQMAMLRARQELGPDALLLHSRPTTSEYRHLGEFEVAFALQPVVEKRDRELAAELERTPLGKQREREEPEPPNLRKEVAELRREMARIAAVMGKPGWKMGGNSTHPELLRIKQELLKQEFSSEWVEELLDAVEEQMGEADTAERVRELVGQLVTLHIPIEAEVGRADSARKIVLVVGAPGVGKTTALVKLAAKYGLASRKPAEFITMDTESVGAVEELRAYAAILGMGMSAVDGPAALARALDEPNRKPFVFVDTPGYGGSDLEALAELAKQLSSRADIDIQLVLPAPFRARDLRRLVNRFQVLRPTRMLCTKVDETDTVGPVLEEAQRYRIPLSFVSAGQQIPEDLAEVTAEWVTERIWRVVPNQTRVGA